MFSRSPYPGRVFGKPFTKCVVTICFIMAAVSAGVTIARTAGWITKTSGSAPSASAPVPTTILASQNARDGVLVMQLRNGGCTPREITRPAGKYFLIVNGTEGREELSIHVRSEGRGKLHQKRVPRGRPFRELLHLTPGTYTVSADGYSGPCKLTITGS